MRIADQTGVVLGCGVLVSARHIVTCAHVLSPARERPTGPFLVDFPRSASGFDATATVAVGGWVPVTDNGRGDVAVLEFDKALAEDISPAVLDHGRDKRGRDARVFGHPVGVANGVWSRGQVADTVGPHNELVQLSPGMATHHERIERGYSGGGVMVDERVVGIVTSSVAGTERLAAFMIPMEVVAVHWQRLVLLPEGRDGFVEPSATQQLIAQFARFEALTRYQERIVALLPTRVRDDIGPPPHSVSSIVEACRLRSELRQLADLVIYFEQGSPSLVRPLEAVLAAQRVQAESPSAETPDELTPDQLRKLTDALVRMRYFLDPLTRKTYFETFVRRARDVLHRQVALTPTTDVYADAENLIQVCLPIPGSLRLFVDAIPPADRVPGTGFGELVLVVEEICIERILTDAERHTLVELVRTAPRDVVASAHRRCLDPFESVGPIDGADPDKLVRRIESLAGRRDRPPRVVHFSEQLAAFLPELRSDLHDWGDRVCARLGARRVDLGTLRQSVTADQLSLDRPVMSVRLVPDSIERSQFLLAITLDRGGGARRQLVANDQPEPIDRLVERVDAAIGHALELVDYDEGFMIEVIVPRALIAEPVDTWPITDEFFEDQIGRRFPIVLRSLERMSEPKVRPQWRRKWRLAQDQRHPDPASMHFLGHESGDTAFAVRERLRSDEKLFLAMGGPPAPHSDKRAPDAYAAALSAGIPYLAWVRDPALEEVLRAALDRALTRHPVRSLVDIVAAWRTATTDDAEAAALAAHITLMVCDEERTPNPSGALDLRAPARRRT
ncbi:VMAP-C domain-containing protein [Asanoa iriomotensis]|uniref:vWA-MoxR associated protein C-terminal domain-containing protein n=1 Tax=Asanoa iriomotensis TaxID=234613 RepID=A0ABQ4CE55_9ACTN|nr:trypsin-like peptidase domain-containing protein [Asanoa iriomotensis]GIF61048.1 hypothetical protein Air01nite_71430 [Asanoa iriomotensis]